MKTDWLKKRQTKYTAYATTYILIVVAVLAAINFLANRYNKSYDATANKQYSLSEQTAKVVKGLNRDIHITYFDETARFPQARDLLDRYKDLSPKIQVTYIDPVRKPQVARAAGYMRDAPILVDSGLRKESAKSLTEEEVTGALIRSLKSGERTACFLSGSGEHDLDDSGPRGYSSLKEALEKNNYKTRSISLAASIAKPQGAAQVGQVAQAKFEIPKDCSVLVAAGPKTAYTAPVVAAIRSYVEGGGHALFLLDTPVAIGKQEQAADNADLEKLLADWGVTANKDLALDLSGLGGIFQLGPEVPVIASYDSQPIVRDMNRIPTAFPLSRTLEAKNGDKTTVEKLFSTTDDSVAVTNASGPIDPKKGRKGPLTLAAAGTYNGGNGVQGRFVVYGTSLWAQNGIFGSRSIGNRDLMLNTFNWLSSDEDLISIRPKEAQDQPLNVNGQRMSLLFWMSVVFFPLAVVGSGMVTWWRRR
ncbi:MAG: GldG family protein [Acidobacteria bacterium]|nr:GldG family protein [Acidobacteriota bacterium]